MSRITSGLLGGLFGGLVGGLFGGLFSEVPGLKGAEPKHARPRQFSQMLRRSAWVLMPGCVLLGDMIFRWRGGLPGTAWSAPGNLLVSLMMSLVFWWGLSRLLAGRSRWRLVAAIGLSVLAALLICTVWGYKWTTGGEPTVATTMYLFEEPRNAWSLITSALTWGWGAGVVGLSVVGAVALGAWRGPMTTTGRALGGLGAALLVLAAAGAKPDSPLEGSPYVSDFAAVRMISQSMENRSKQRETFLPIRPRRAVDASLFSEPNFAESNLPLPDLPLPRASDEDVHAAHPAGPNVLLIVNESLNRDHMHVMGYPRENTPHLDAFFAQKVDEIYDFSQAFVSGSSTIFSWAALLTGRYTAQTREELGAATLPWSFAQAAGIWTFLVTPQDWSWMAMQDYFLTLDPPDFWATADSFHAPVVHDTGVDDALAIDAAIAQLDKAAEKNARFFGIVQTNATHFPFWAKDDVSWPTDSTSARYDAAVARVDASVGRLLDALRDAALLEDTVIIFLSDHGEFIYGVDQIHPADAGMRVRSCHPAVAQTPFFIYLPKKWQAAFDIAQLRANTARPISHVDILPTLLDLWGYQDLGAPEGRPGARPQGAEAANSASMDGMSLFRSIAADRAVWCFNQPSWWMHEPTVGFAIFSAQRMAYVRGDVGNIRFFRGAGWLADRRWPRWDALDAADRRWLARALDSSPFVGRYIDQIRLLNPPVAAELSPRRSSDPALRNSTNRR